MTEQTLSKLEETANRVNPSVPWERRCPSSALLPDTDAIKMFVGQIPRSWVEEDVRNLFREFGPIHQVEIIRDRMTSESKGCCFVMFYERKSALDAESALHNKKVLPGMRHPIQMKPAESEDRNGRKIFVGMLNKLYDENDVHDMFDPFGAIEDCTVLRDSYGHSKGCAFVIFSSKWCAANAIKHMHHSVVMEGCSSPLVVKFADTPKVKDLKRKQRQTLADLSTLSQMFARTPVNDALSGLQYLPQLLTSVAAPFAMQNIIAASVVASQSLRQFQTSSIGNLGYNQLPSEAMKPFGSVAMNLNNPPAYPPGCLSARGYDQVFGSLHADYASSEIATQTYVGLQQESPVSTLARLQNMAASAARSPATKQSVGPEGANLFIYHLPPEFTDVDLVRAFAPFGHLVSAKVFIDRQTNLSKCFGFVSYDNPSDAEAAIRAMNGTTIGSKRLKVQLKKSNSTYRPY